MDTARAKRYAAFYRQLSMAQTATEEQRRAFRMKAAVYAVMAIE